MTVNQLNNKCSDYRLIFDNVSLFAGDKVILENESFNITYNNIVILKGQIGSGNIKSHSRNKQIKKRKYFSI